MDLITAYTHRARPRDVLGYMVCRSRPRGIPEYGVDAAYCSAKFYGPDFSYAVHANDTWHLTIQVTRGTTDDAISFFTKLAGKYIYGWVTGGHDERAIYDHN